MKKEQEAKSGLLIKSSLDNPIIQALSKKMNKGVVENDRAKVARKVIASNI